MKVTEVPVQIVLLAVTIETEGTTVALTVIVTVLDVAVAGDAQVALDVMITVTVFPLIKVEEVKVLELVPTLLPFTCH